MDTFLIPIQFNVNNSEHVYLLQQILVFVLKDELGGEKTITSNEIESRTYGSSTIEAIAYFQEKYGLIQTPQVSEETINQLNILAQKRYRVYGYTNDDVNLPVDGIVLKLYRKLLNEQSEQMGEGISLKDGSYRIYLDFTGKEDLLQNGTLKNQLCAIVNFLQNDTLLYSSDEFFISELETLQDFSSEKFIYTGESTYASLINILSINGLNVEDLIQKSSSQIQTISSVTNIDTETLMRLVFAVSLNQADAKFPISVENAFGYLSQDFPPNMPTVLYSDNTDNTKTPEEIEAEWNYYKEEKKEFILSGMELLTKDEHIDILTNALKLRYVSRLTQDEIEDLVERMIAHKYELLEVLPILEGNTSIGAVSSIMKNIIVDNPDIWKTNSGFTKNLVPAKKKTKVQQKIANIFDSLFERDYENTGSEDCWAEKIDDYTIEFKGEVAYSTNLNSEYRNNGITHYGSYVGIMIRIPEGQAVNPYEFECYISNNIGEEHYLYYNELSQKEISEQYIHIYLNLSALNPDGDFPQEHYINIRWGGDHGDEQFQVITREIHLEPYYDHTGMGIIRDMLHVGGETCNFEIHDPNNIKFYGQVQYNKGIKSLGNPISGYYMGVAIIAPNRDELRHFECSIEEIRDSGSYSRTINPETLGKEEMTGGFFHVYFDLFSKEGQLREVHIYTSFGEYHIYAEWMDFLHFTQIERDLKYTGGSGCEMHCNDDIFVIFSGEVIYAKEPIVPQDGNYVGIYIYPPFTPEGYDMREVHCYSENGQIDIRYDNLSDKEKENKFIHVLLDLQNISYDRIIVNWGSEFTIENNTHLLQQGELPYIPIGQGYISRDANVGGSNCQATTSGNNTISFRGQIDWLASKGGNYIAINLFAPEGNYDLSNLRYRIRNEWFSYNNLSPAEKQGRRIHIFLGYSATPSNDVIYVEWRYNLQENFYITIESGTILQANPNPPIEQHDFDEWKLTLTEIFTNNISSYDDFVIEAKEREAELYPADVNKVVTCFDVSRVVMNYTPVMESILQLPEIEQYGARSLATLSQDDYLNMLSPGEYPTIIPGDTPEEKRENYATVITDSAQKLYPEIFVVSEIERKQTAGAITKFDKIGEIKEVLLEHPTFDLLVDKVDTLQVSQEAKTQLIAIQDVYKITPTPTATVAFIEAGFESAKEIYAIGKEQAVTLLDGRLSQADAETTYKAATASTAELLTAYTDINNKFHVSDFAVIKLDNKKVKKKINEDTGIDFPTLEDLFGDEGSYCDCDHDSSIYSAAAYLGDLLYYLNHRKANDDKSDKTMVKKHLIDRRPDIDKIILNKQNTVTIMPYIDIVCEVLEEALLKTESPQYERTTEQYQSTLSSKELLAAPEHVLSLDEGGTETAYYYLKEKIYPMYAPLDLYQLETRSYLNDMELKYYELIQNCRNKNNLYEPERFSEIATEFFTLTAFEKEIVTAGNIDLNTRNTAWRIWINSSSGDEIKNMPVADFMEDSGTSIFEVLDLLKSQWIGFVPVEIIEDCSFAGKFISGTPAAFDRAHRFIRLWRKSGWKIWELDLLLRNPIIAPTGSQHGDGKYSYLDSLNVKSLGNLMLFKEQQELLTLSVEELLAFYGQINLEPIYEDGKEIPCLYDKLFLQKSITNPLNNSLINIKEEGGGSYNGSFNLLAACIGITMDDFIFLRQEYNSILEFNLFNFLYRHSILARKTKIKIQDLYRLLQLMKIKNLDSDPNTSYYNINLLEPYTSVLELNQVIKQLQVAKNSALAVSEYDYLVAYGYNLEEDYTISDAVKTISLKKVQMDEFAVRAKDLFLQIPNSDDISETYTAILSYINIFTNYLLQIGKYSQGNIDELIPVIECRSGKTNEDIDAFINELFPEESGIEFEGNLHNIILTSKDALIARYKQVIDYVNATTIETLIINLASDFFELDTSYCNLYLRYEFDNERDNLLSTLCIESNYENPEFYGIYDVLMLIHKAVLTIKKDDINFVDFESLLDIYSLVKEHFSNYDYPIWFNWFSFPTKIEDNEETNKTSLSELLELYAMLSLQKEFDSDDKGNTLFDILKDYKENYLYVIKNICRFIGWDFTEEDYPRLQMMTSIQDVDMYNSETYVQLSQIYSIKEKTGLEVATLEQWVSSPLYFQEKYNQVKDAAKSQYTLDQWLEKLPEIQKPIRETKSDALASYLIAYSLRGNIPNVLWDDKNALYAYFLLDVEMSACMKISRIVQATSSVQLFVQRCFLNLEENIIVDEYTDTRWAQWEWMKKYRLWEANRKVFLYPENWIEPELRDNKTIFFKELEDELAQGEITAENVETAFENYLQKLNDVSNLVVCGVYNEIVNDDDGIVLPDGRKVKTSRKAIVHVIGRSKSVPYQYYYRTYDAYAGEWKEWEKIELDIQSDMVVPVVYNRNLHLFWLSVVPKSINQNTANENKQPLNYAEVQLVWSVLKNGKWKGINRSQRKIILNGNSSLFDYSILMRYNKESNNLIMDVFRRSDYITVTSGGETTYLDYNGIYYGGYFMFDGNVNLVVNNGDSFKWENILLNMEIDNQPSIFETLSSYTSEERQKLLKRIPIYKETSPLFSYTKMYSNRMYIEGSAIEKKIVKLLGNSNQDSAFNIIETIASEANLISGLYGYKNTLAMSNVLNSYINGIFFYQDSKRSFYIEPYEPYYANIIAIETIPSITLPNFASKIEPGKLHRYLFRPFYHPYTSLFIKELNRAGIEGLLNRDLQLNPNLYYPQNDYDFKSTYNPDETYVMYDKNSKDKCVDFLDFSYKGAYSNYNWELFFHVPLYLACKLSQDQKFEDAMHWFHYIFNPTTKEAGESPQKFWITKMFYEMTTEDNRAQQIENVLKNIKTHAQSVNVWLNNPYNPHAVARTRPVAYQRTVVMKYLDNLIAWADQLFRQDSIESNNEATLLYILAYEILGKRPVMLPQKQLQNNTIARTSIAISSGFQEFQAAYIENTSTPLALNVNLATPANVRVATSGDLFKASPYFDVLNNDIQATAKLADISLSAASFVTSQYRSAILPSETNTNNETIPTEFDMDNFCIPANEEMFKYWDTVEDRLFKLRNCMNIEGIVRELPLFEPPIDPAMLVKAAAAGLSISEALNDITAPQPYYRFRTILQKAVEYTSEVKQLGDKLLSALEKKDAETLNILRSTQEINLQQANIQVRKLQINEAKENIENINALIATTTARKEYYLSREFINAGEAKAYGLSITANVFDTVGSQLSTIATSLGAIPDFTGGFPIAAATFGGSNLCAIMNAVAMSLSSVAKTMDRSASQSLTMAGYVRRMEDWLFQAQMATMELTQLQTQLAAAEIRLMVAEKELENMQMQIEQSKTILEYYKDKYTNEALYNWMITQVSSIYFQSYKLAYDMAKKAEKCYQHELGIYDPPSFINFGYWDSLKKGLLSGERLIHDLHKLEASYLDKNKRTLELTKHISMAQMFPRQLIQLITEGSVMLDLEEFIFDMDYPGHYMRRIKSVSVTIPNVAGAYTNVSFMLTLQSAKVRKNTSGEAYDETNNLNDPRFVYQTGGRESICTSSAQNDSGMFELNFGDERYLPFENAGVISRWGMSLPAGVNQFDLSTISDVILHINYTALYDGNLAIKAKEALQDKLPTAGAMLFSPKQDFPDAWNKMDESNESMNFEIKNENVPFFLRGESELKVDYISVMFSMKNDSATNLNNLSISLNKGDDTISIDMEQMDEPNGNILLFKGMAIGRSVLVRGDWTLSLGSLDISEIEEFVVGFTLIDKGFDAAEVRWTTPQNNETVETDTEISVQFSKSITARKLSNIRLKDNSDNIIPINVTINGSLLTIAPRMSLENSKIYTVLIPDETLYEYFGEYTFSFETLPAIAVVNTNPTNGQENVPIDTSIEINFNRDITLINPNLIILSNGVNAVPFTPSINGTKLTIKPVSDFPLDADIKVTIQDGAIKYYLDAFILAFKTQPPLAIESTNPTNGQENVSIDTTIGINFNRNITLLNSNLISISDGTNLLPFTTNVAGAKLTIKSISDFPLETNITIIIENGAIKEFSGTSLTFKTRALFPTPIFYAPLTIDKNPTIAWDKNVGVHTAGNGVIRNGELYIAGTAATYGLIWNCKPPMGKNITFNMWVKPNSYSSGMNHMHGWKDLGGARNTGCSFAKIYNNNYNGFYPEYLNLSNSALGIIAPLSTYTFISWTIKFNLPNITLVVYADGIKKGEWTVTNANFLGITNNSQFTIGTSVMLILI